MGVVAEGDADYVREAMALLPARPWDEGSWREWTGAVKAGDWAQRARFVYALAVSINGVRARAGYVKVDAFTFSD